MLGVLVFLAGITVGAIGTLSVLLLASRPPAPVPVPLPAATTRRIRRARRAERLDIGLAMARPGADRRIEPLPSVYDLDREETR